MASVLTHRFFQSNQSRVMTRGVYQHSAVAEDIFRQKPKDNLQP